jgi:predicted HicB family RNase H-like nuclease
MDDHQVLSVRVDAELAAELRDEATRTGASVSDLLRRGIGAVLEPARAVWLDEHGADPDLWEDITDDEIRPGPRRALDSRFGVRVDGEQLRLLSGAAAASGMRISAFMREASLAVAAARLEGGTASCAHLSAGAVTEVSCGVCGPLTVRYQIAAA